MLSQPAAAGGQQQDQAQLCPRLQAQQPGDLLPHQLPAASTMGEVAPMHGVSQGAAGRAGARRNVRPKNRATSGGWRRLPAVRVEYRMKATRARIGAFCLPQHDARPAAPGEVPYTAVAPGMNPVPADEPACPAAPSRALEHDCTEQPRYWWRGSRGLLGRDASRDHGADHRLCAEIGRAAAPPGAAPFTPNTMPPIIGPSSNAAGSPSAPQVNGDERRHPSSNKPQQRRWPGSGGAGVGVGAGAEAETPGALIRVLMASELRRCAPGGGRCA